MFRKFFVLFVLLAFSGAAFAGTDGADMDEKSKEWADRTVAAMGGRDAYNSVRFLTWDFFGRRFHVWDKHTGRYRVDDKQGKVVLMNLNDKSGKAFVNGEALEGEALNEALEWAYSVWVNDAYWLVMPYKLHDPGVTLRFDRMDETPAGDKAAVLTMTFAEVGLTPENKYEVYIAENSGLVRYWAYFEKAENHEPDLATPWDDWQKYGPIMLSGNRGKYALEHVHVPSDVPDSVFTDPAKPAIQP